jgi:hypothetical protein
MNWRHSQRIAYHSGPRDIPLETRFPRAVAGEEYDRYARAMWPQAQRWLRKHWYRLTPHDLSVQDAQDVMRCLAAFDVARRLYGQEERLITELLQHVWHERHSAGSPITAL